MLTTWADRYAAMIALTLTFGMMIAIPAVLNMLTRREARIREHARDKRPGY